MILNIFSIFDPSTSSVISLNWLSIFFLLLFFPNQYWLLPSHIRYTWHLFLKFIFKEYKTLINYSYSNLIIFLRIFFTIFFNNFIGLFPYIFTRTSHIRFCLSISISIWLRIIFYWIFNYLNEIFSHLTPQRTPFLLIPFIVIIESIRLFIRPLTLAIRLIANIVAGHILLSLLGNSIIHLLSLRSIFIIIFIQILLYILEIAVSLIQAYVFSILSVLYSREI